MKLRDGAAAMVTALVAGLVVVTSGSAAAERTCHWDSAAGRLRCDNAAPGGPPAGGGGGGSQGSPLGRWFVWVNDIVPDPTRSCPADPLSGQPPQRKYLQFLPTGDPSGARTVRSWCPPNDIAIPPPPPTPAQLRGLAQAPAPTVNLSPNGRGVTGLPVLL